jgi:predicted short-subunit dehydrogenase-like oxidoreductase (DUF2520 family)
VTAKAGRLGVGIVGAGRVGPVLGAALAGAGHAIVGVAAVSEANRERARAMLADVPILEIPDLIERSELVILAIPQAELASLVAGLAATGAWQPGQLVLHTAPGFGTDVLRPAMVAGAIPLAVHPAMTFTGTSVDLARLRECYFAVTAPAPVLPIAQALVVEMGAEPVVVAEELRPLYHAGLAHGSNHLFVLVAQALETLRLAGVEEPARLLGPLMSASLDNALRRGEDALTGPVARGDAETVAVHVEAFTRAGAAEILATYRSLARTTADRALASGRLRPESAEALLSALAGPADPV